ncbi:hypothetical protein E2C01_021707 [Portunus trituberculatus]|uniref:Uncharacterized protein n=1 Tax=Portunus trituberculatus TaxID=210409 RepID=A0A5B7E3A9_PORTR|nr:hypothetical protein [Portunus trituberculatus]
MHYKGEVGVYVERSIPDKDRGPILAGPWLHPNECLNFACACFGFLHPTIPLPHLIPETCCGLAENKR